MASRRLFQNTGPSVCLSVSVSLSLSLSLFLGEGHYLEADFMQAAWGGVKVREGQPPSPLCQGHRVTTQAKGGARVTLNS